MITWTKNASHWLLFVIVVVQSVTVCTSKSRGKGTLRVRITRFTNPTNKIADGSCCSFYKNSPVCRGVCKTFFRICAASSGRPLILRKRTKSPLNLSSLLSISHLGRDRDGKSSLPTIQPNYSLSIDYQRHKFYKFQSAYADGKGTYADGKGIHANGKGIRIPSFLDSSRSRLRGGRMKLTSEQMTKDHLFPCTYGSVVTGVIANSSLEAEKDGVLQVDFPFDSPWSISFKLLIEAWNSESQNESSNEIIQVKSEPNGSLVARHVARHMLMGNGDWRPFKYSLNRDSAIHYSIKVACQSPFFGSKCSTRCDNLRSLSKNNRVNCTANGEVRCLNGWMGDACNKAVCKEECHSIHGYCTQPGECKCALGWRGKNCDECVPLPGCKHGFCNKTSYECICEKGWQGSYCSIPVCGDGCHSAKGYCKLPGECRCRIGWSGDTCESCKSLPGCVNGYCTKPLECRCRKGWTGIHCDQPTCKSKCSQVNGFCTKPGECRCKVGWWGDNCDTCYPYPGCKHGTCNRPWECNCKTGWKGMLCNKKINEGATYCEKHPNTCLNGGTCENVDDDRNYTCSCNSKFTGKRCDYAKSSRGSFFPIFRPRYYASRSKSLFTSTISTTTYNATVSPPAIPTTEKVIPEETTTTTTEQPQTTTLKITAPTMVSAQVPTTSTVSSDIVEEDTTASILPSDDYRRLKSTSMSVSTSYESFGTTDFPILSNEESKSGGKMSVKVTKLGPASPPEISTESSTEATSTETTSTEINTTEYTVDNIEDATWAVKIDPKIIELNNRRRKYLYPKNPRNWSLEKNREEEEDQYLPTEELYARISKIPVKSESPLVLILQLNEQNGDFQSVRGDSPITNQITSRFLIDSSSPIHRINPAFIPLLMTQQDSSPSPSNLRSSPYLVEGFDNNDNFRPPTRINRRKAPRFHPIQEDEEVEEEEEEEEEEKVKKISYYEENYDGRVHIGDVTEVDENSPLEEIVKAFIELKKLKS